MVASKRMRILFVLPRMVSGGVERVSLNLIAEYVAAGHTCMLALRQRRGELLGEASAMIDVYELAPRGLQQFVPRLARLVRRWKPTHVVTAFPDVGAMTWLAMRLAHSRARWVHGVHGSLVARAGSLGAARCWLDTRLAAFVVGRADAVVAVSEGVRKEFVHLFHPAVGKMHMIHNPVVPRGQLIAAGRVLPEHGRPINIVAMGRLSPEKGFDLLIAAMKWVPQPWRLDIWGEGGAREALESLVDAYGLRAFVRLPGFTPAPYDVLRRADLFVLPSRYEGFGNVLVEALACQCQIVAFDCPHGPSEILDDGRYGTLVPQLDICELACAISAVLAGDIRFEPMSLLQQAGHYTTRAAAIRWEAVLSGGAD